MSRSASITMSAWAANSPPRNCSAKSRWATTRQQRRASWRVVRARNKWQPAEDCARHPVPGTYPVVITGEAEWGGWRVPGAEYDLDPAKVEEQARLIASAPQLAAFASSLVDWARKSGEDMPNELAELAHQRPGPPGRGQARLVTALDHPAGRMRLFPLSRARLRACLLVLGGFTAADHAVLLAAGWRSCRPR